MGHNLGRAELLENARKMQRGLCAYFGHGRCDCKYGGDKVRGWGEQGNGCPEMRNIIELLERMTDKEYQRTLKRKLTAAPNT